MALRACPHCGGRISDRATVCPHCGARLDVRNEREESQKSKKGLWIVLIVLIIAALAAVAVIYFMGKGNGAEKTAIAADTTAIDSTNIERTDTVALKAEKPRGVVKPEVDKSAARVAFLREIKNESERLHPDLSYSLFDITGDGIPELWIDTGEDEAERQIEVYTFANGSMEEIYKESSGHSSFYMQKGNVIQWYSQMGEATWTELSYDDKTKRIKDKEVFSQYVEDADDYKIPQGKQMQFHSPDDTQPVISIFE